MQITPEQVNEINRFRGYFPYRKLYLHIDGGKWEIIAPKDRRPINKMLREGATIYEVKR